MRTWVYTVLYAGLGGVFVLVLVLEEKPPSQAFDLSSSWITWMIAGIAWLSYLRLFIPRCPKCGMGVFSIVEVAKFPIIVKSWVSSKCFECGEKLE